MSKTLTIETFKNGNVMELRVAGDLVATMTEDTFTLVDKAGPAYTALAIAIFNFYRA